MIIKEVDWNTLKSFVNGRRSVSLQYFDEGEAYWMWATQGPIVLRYDMPKEEPASEEQLDFESNYMADANKDIKTGVFSPTEEPTLDLMLASDEKPFIGNTCMLSIPIPGTPGTIQRKLAGGYVFTDKFCWGDRVKDVHLMDKDYLFAGSLYPATPTEAGIEGVEGLSWSQVAPNGVMLGTQTDMDLPEHNRGWRLWCDEGNQGGGDVDPLGELGRMLAGAYLEVEIVKGPASEATYGCINLWWAKILD